MMAPPMDPAERIYNDIVATSGPPLRIVTRCESIDAFIGAFRHLVSEHHLILALRAARPVGTRLRFSIRLADGTPVFVGAGRVVECLEGAGGRMARLKVEIVVLDEESRTMHLCLLMANKPPPSSPDAARELAADLQRRMRDTLPMSADLLAELTRRLTGDLPAPPAAASRVPANPFGGLSFESLEQFVECTIYEDPSARASGFVSGTIDTPAAATRRVSATLPPPPRHPRVPVAPIVAVAALAGVIGTVAAYLLWG